MATGLDRIIERIRTDAQTRAAEKIADAENDAAKHLAEAAKAAEQQAEEQMEAAKKNAADTARRADAAAEFNRRRAVLAAKQDAIRATVAEAKERLCALPDGEYFPVLLKLLAANAAPGKAELRLGAKDLARKPQDFAAQVAQTAKTAGAEITLSDTPCDISDGFLLVYDGIDVNCTFDSLFASKADALQDIAGGILFG